MINGAHTLLDSDAPSRRARPWPRCWGTQSVDAGGGWTMFLRAPADAPLKALQPAGDWARVSAYAAGLASLLLGLASGLVLRA